MEQTKGLDSQKINYGVLAQEVKEIIPEIVSGEREEDFHSVEYNGFIPLMIEALKELNEICVPCDKDLMQSINELRDIFENELAPANKLQEQKLSTMIASKHEQDVTYESLLGKINALKDDVSSLSRSIWGSSESA